jgi:7-cyano-7-deazaguanine reductase
MPNLDPALIEKIKGLKLNPVNEIQPGILIKLPNRHPDTNFKVTVRTSEFTSLCPLSVAQPDYAFLLIVYCPDKWVVELKSLKLYFVSYRNTEIFHEEIPTTMLKHLTELIEPRWMKIVGKFTTRGGIDTEVIANYGKNLPKDEDR